VGWQLPCSLLALHRICSWLQWLYFHWLMSFKEDFLLLDVDKLWMDWGHKNLFSLVASMRFEPRSPEMKNWFFNPLHWELSFNLIAVGPSVTWPLQPLTINHNACKWRGHCSMRAEKTWWVQLWCVNKPCDQWRNAHKASLCNLERREAFPTVKWDTGYHCDIKKTRFRDLWWLFSYLPSIAESWHLTYGLSCCYHAEVKCCKFCLLPLWEKIKQGTSIFKRRIRVNNGQHEWEIMMLWAYSQCFTCIVTVPVL
jgi:hypothetical protein